ncbi:hypothetical protein J7K93_10645 [bacterium]|nr:hypothetical protein [bacterium]
MALKKWIYISVAAVFFASAVILAVTAGLVRWRKKANYPPSSASITARSSIRFVLKDTNSGKSSAGKPADITETDKGKYKSYVRFRTEEPVSGFIAFQSSLDRYGLNISDVAMLFPQTRVTISVDSIKNRSTSVNIGRIVSITVGNVVTASFMLNSIDFSFDYQNSRIISAIGVAEVDFQENQKPSDILHKQLYEGFLQDSENYKSKLIIKTSIPGNTDSKEQLLLIIDEISYKVI